LPSHSRPWLRLVGKEWRELLSSRAWWVLLFLIGPLVGVTFTGAVRTYAEASGLGGSVAGVGEAFSPLDGIWMPTFVAYEIAAAFLLPFVAIRLVTGDRRSGALKIELQRPMSPWSRVAAKAVVLLVGSCLAGVPALVAGVLWKIYGGSMFPPELGSLALGHLLNAGLTIALAAAVASIVENPSTAAILVLSVTVGTWILGFIASLRGGLWAAAAAFTPEAMLDTFQHGLVSLGTLLAALAFIATGLSVAALWTRLGVSRWRRAFGSVGAVAAGAALVVACVFVRLSWDVSENQRNSFAAADEEVLARIRGPLSIEVHLAPQDPRRSDLEHRVLSKLRRAMPSVKVRYISATSIGLFEQADPGYGEIWYDIGGKRTMSRLITEEGVLETIYGLAGVPPPSEAEPSYAGHPLAAKPRGAAAVFYGLWPVSIAGLGFSTLRRKK
jgi:ABC-2 type transport system permease protein